MPAIKNRFKSQHTRVSAAILFYAGRGIVEDRGMGQLLAARVVDNPRASQPAPDWLLQQFKALVPRHAEEMSPRE